jgi:hypothetical protein
MVQLQTTSGPLQVWSYGLHPATQNGGAAQWFQPGYRGMRLGPWSLPRTIPPNHVEDATFDAADPLGMTLALGLRLGPYGDVMQTLGGLQGTYVPVLPSRNAAFPMDTCERATGEGGGGKEGGGGQACHRVWSGGDGGGGGEGGRSVAHRVSYAFGPAGSPHA